jgi:hypothetical protein
MLQLTDAEQAWLDAYRKALEQKHPVEAGPGRTGAIT